MVVLGLVKQEDELQMVPVDLELLPVGRGVLVEVSSAIFSRRMKTLKERMV